MKSSVKNDEANWKNDDTTEHVQNIHLKDMLALLP